MFFPAAIQPNTSIYSGFYRVHAVIPPTTQNSAHGFTGSFPAIWRILPLLCGCASCYIAPSAPRWSVSQRPDALQHIPDTTVTPRSCTGQHSCPTTIYCNKVYKGTAYHRPCKPGGGLDASHTRRLETWHRFSGHGAPAGTLYPAWQSGNKGTAGGAELLTATAVSLFGLSPDSQ